MKFYLASKFALKDNVRRLCAILEAGGHQVPDVWWNIDGKNHPEQDNRKWHSLPMVRAIAIRHWNSIAQADALILVSHPETPMTFTGANVEVGYAIGKGIPVFSIGKLERSGMYSPVIQCETIDELLEAISIYSLKTR